MILRNPIDVMYSLHATLEGYYPIATRIDEENVSDHHYHQIRKNLYVVPLVEGEVVLMNNIRFPLECQSGNAE